MEFFPLFARLQGEPCLLVGAGEVAARKARALLDAGAQLTVNAPRCGPSMQALLQANPAVHWQQGPFDPGLLATHLLVLAATSDPATNRAVATAARAARRLCNVADDGAASSVLLPAVVDRSPLLVAISSGGHAPLLARALRQRLEQWLPLRLGALARWSGRWRATVRARVRDPAARRRLWEQLLGGAAAARVLEDDEAGADALAMAYLDGPPLTAADGQAWLVGAGPGDPDLISVRGLQILREADVVLHDRLVDPRLLRAARREAEIICVGKTGGGISTSQEDINRLLISRVRAGRRVCRLKGGDPLIFGRGGEEALALAAAGLRYEIVPGITAANGCAAAAGIPLTHRGRAAALTLVTARAAADGDAPDWSHLAVSGATLTIYMGGSRVEDICSELMRHGRAGDTPAALISNGTLPGQEVVRGTLADIGARCRVCRSLSPALLIVGETVALPTALAQTRRQPPGSAALDDPLPAPAFGAVG
ncbi:MAG: siroheme synthase CysG [Gammaproteobacteria bacterium]|nr:MAG: siroheme synthase CysG [Gammaproteobacteria bacterium]